MVNTIKYMKRQGITTYGEENKKIRIRVPTTGLKRFAGGVVEAAKSTGRGLAIMSKGARKASRSKTGKKVRNGLTNAYNNWYGR